MSITTSASAKVFGIFELLEPILLKTDMQTVLLAQRVNYFFYSCIKNSPKLQQKLFFRALPADSTPTSEPSKPKRNLLLRAKGPYVHLKGLRSFYLIRSEATIEDEDVPEVEFSNFNLDMLRHTLTTYRPSFMDMHLFRTPVPKGKLTIRNEEPDVSRVDWDELTAEVPMSTVGKLLEVAMYLQNVMEGLIRAENEKPDHERTLGYIEFAVEGLELEGTDGFEG